MNASRRTARAVSPPAPIVFGDEASADLVVRAHALLASNPGAALALARKAQERAIAVGEDAVVLEAMRLIGTAHHMRGELREAAVSFAGAALGAQARADARAEMMCRNGLAASLACLGDLNAALEQGLETIALARRVGNPSGMAKSLNNLGFVHERLQDLPGALGYYKAAYREYRDARLPAALALMNVACMHEELGRTRLAARLYSSALNGMSETGDRLNEAHTLANLARALISAGKMEPAKQAIDRSLALARQHGHRRQEARALAQLGRWHGGRGDWSVARNAFAACIQLAEAAGCMLEMRPALQGLMRAHETLAERAELEAVRRRLLALDEEAARQRSAQSGEKFRLTAEIEQLRLDAARHRRRAQQLRRSNRELRAANAQLRQIRAPVEATLVALSPRENEVLRLVIAGLSNEEIGCALGVSRFTARTHVAAILKKLGARTRAEAAAVAVKAGLASGTRA